MSLAAYNVPLLVRFNYESHAVAGVIVGLAIAFGIAAHLPRLGVLGIAVGTALLIGAGKEYLVDLHANPREILPWGLGAAAAIAFKNAI